MEELYCLEQRKSRQSSRSDREKDALKERLTAHDLLTKLNPDNN
jgi:hypothetical protein